MTFDIFPWNKDKWQQLIAYKQQNRLPHALLLMGIKGLGKRDFAHRFAHFLLCTEPTSMPCGQCHACHLIAAESHPDLIFIEPEKSGQMIKIEQIRDLIQSVNETTLQGGLRIIIIHPAHSMNTHAENALLKTLEEPAPNTIMMLISEQHLQLPATITSRCQKLIFQKPTYAVALTWLKTQLTNTEQKELTFLLNFAEGAPLRAKELAEQNILVFRQELFQGLTLLSQRKVDPLQLAAQHQECDMQLCLTLLLSWLQDLLRFKLAPTSALLIHVDYQPVFQKIAPRILMEMLVHYLDHVKKIYAHITNSLNLNRLLTLEELFIRWIEYAAG